MLRTIVTGVDGREGGRDALRLAAGLASVTEGDIIAVSAYPHFARPAVARAPGVREQHDATAAMLEDELAEIGVRAETRVVADASPGRALHEIAQAEGADIIVVGSTRRGAVGRVLAGDDALGALLGSPVPVAVAPRGYEGAGSRPQRIGVGVDDTDESAQALALAAALAGVSGAALDLLGVVNSPAALGAEAIYSMSWLEEYRVEREGRLKATAAGLGVAADVRAVIGTPAEELVSLSQHVDMLFVGSRAWGPVRRILLGSTAAGLMRRSACPLVVVPRGAGTGGTGAAPAEGERGGAVPAA
jgi:nucleotide-binding universal stress UspA family protein